MLTNLNVGLYLRVWPSTETLIKTLAKNLVKDLGPDVINRRCRPSIPDLYQGPTTLCSDDKKGATNILNIGLLGGRIFEQASTADLNRSGLALSNAPLQPSKLMIICMKKHDYLTLKIHVPYIVRMYALLVAEFCQNLGFNMKGFDVNMRPWADWKRSKNWNVGETLKKLMSTLTWTQENNTAPAPDIQNLV